VGLKEPETRIGKSTGQMPEGEEESSLARETFGGNLTVGGVGVKDPKRRGRAGVERPAATSVLPSTIPTGPEKWQAAWKESGNLTASVTEIHLYRRGWRKATSVANPRKEKLGLWKYPDATPERPGKKCRNG